MASKSHNASTPISFSDKHDSHVKGKVCVLEANNFAMKVRTAPKVVFSCLVIVIRLLYAMYLRFATKHVRVIH